MQLFFWLNGIFSLILETKCDFINEQILDFLHIQTRIPVILNTNIRLAILIQIIGERTSFGEESILKTTAKEYFQYRRQMKFIFIRALS